MKFQTLKTLNVMVLLYCGLYRKNEGKITRDQSVKKSYHFDFQIPYFTTY